MASTQPLDVSAKRPRRTFRAIVAPDMTPMVGVGFLLVSFFLLTTALERPTVMQLSMPVKPAPDEMGAGGPLCGFAAATTIILGKDSQVYYYDGLLDATMLPELYKTDFSASGLRKVLLQRDSRTFFLIKPSNEAKYQDMVDALDEMNITDRKKYALVDISAAEYDLVKNGRL